MSITVLLDGGSFKHAEDAALVIALVNAAPALLAEIEGLRERLARQDARMKLLERLYKADVGLDLCGAAMGDAYTGTQARTYGAWQDERRAALDALPAAPETSE